MEIDLYPHHVRMLMKFDTNLLNNWFPPRLFRDYVADVCHALEVQGPNLLKVEMNGVPVPPSKVTATQRKVGELQVELLFPVPKDLKKLSVENRTFSKLPADAMQDVSAEDRRSLPPRSTAAAPRRYQMKRLSLDEPVYEIDVEPPLPPDVIAPPPPANEGKGYFIQGVKHILTGYDHLLFVAALLLACRTFREAVTIITFFTVAHSITLTLAATDIIRLGKEIVEPAIAGTIVFVAVENLVHRPKLRFRCAITFGFGLIHGLGFASDLRDMFEHITFRDILWPLLKFSAGVESGHLTLVALALPVLLWLKQNKPVFDRRWVPACSIAISLVGAYWLATRVAESLGHPIAFSAWM